MVFLSDPGVSRGLRQPWVVPGYSLIFLMKVEMTEITIQAVNISTPVSVTMCGQQRGQWEEASLGLRLWESFISKVSVLEGWFVGIA